MPERPDLEYVVPILEREIVGGVVAAVRVDNPVVLRVAFRDPVQILEGGIVRQIRRRAHFVLFDVEAKARPLQLVFAPMLAGRFSITPNGARKPADLAFTLVLQDNRELRFRDDVQMGKVYVIGRDGFRDVPGLGQVGVDVLDPKRFTSSAFRELARKRRDQTKVFLMDKTALDAMGNAYADEVLFEAKIHPKTMVRSLSDEDLERLRMAIVTVLENATAEIARRKPPLEEKVRDFLKVRGRHGDPCPRCGGTIRKTGVHGHDAFFCPTCQPDVRGTSVVSWSRKGGLGNR